MDISPQRVRTAEFKTVKKGLDPDEVRSFLDVVAAELERAQNQSTAMEARARAAVARLQEISEATSAASEAQTEPAPEPIVAAVPEPAAVAPVAEVTPSVDQADTISRTLLLAQRTADTAIAEAEAEAARLRSDAEAEATQTIDSAREITERLTNEARDEARRQGEAERIQVESEVNALLARRDFLESDVDHLQTFLVDERTRLREAASEIMELVERVPGGLGEVRRPLLSASDDEEQDAAARASSGPATASDATAASTASAAHLPTGEMPTIAPDRSNDDDAVVDESDDDELSDEFPLSGSSETAGGDDQAERLVIQTDIADDGPTGFSYDTDR